MVFCSRPVFCDSYSLLLHKRDRNKLNVESKDVQFSVDPDPFDILLKWHLSLVPAAHVNSLSVSFSCMQPLRNNSTAVGFWHSGSLAVWVIFPELKYLLPTLLYANIHPWVLATQMENHITELWTPVLHLARPACWRHWRSELKNGRSSWLYISNKMEKSSPANVTGCHKKK